MEKTKAIESAQGVAMLRALGSKEKDEKFRNPDYMASHFLGKKYKFLYRLFNFASTYSRKLLEYRAPGTYWYLFARTKYLDEVVERALKEGIEQFVILGAGYDSRIYRMADQLKNVACFEVDFPATQLDKKNYLHNQVSPLPSNVTFVPIDFNSQSLEEELFKNGYLTDKRTLFLWEGVCMYLPYEAVENVLSFIKNQSPSGSLLAFDYFIEQVVKGKDLEGYGTRATFENAASIGEPFITGFDPSKLDALMQDMGFKVIDNLSAKTLSDKYLAQPNQPISRLMIECAQFALLQTVNV